MLINVNFILIQTRKKVGVERITIWQYFFYNLSDRLFPIFCIFLELHISSFFFSRLKIVYFVVILLTLIFKLRVTPSSNNLEAKSSITGEFDLSMNFREE